MSQGALLYWRLRDDAGFYWMRGGGWNHHACHAQSFYTKFDARGMRDCFKGTGRTISVIRVTVRRKPAKPTRRHKKP